MVLPALLLAATSAAAEKIPGLFWMRSVAVVGPDGQDLSEYLHGGFSQTLPDIDVVPADEADVVIKYWENPEAQSWTANVVRFDCQSASFGERPTRAINGHCENLVYVRVIAGTKGRTAPEGVSAAEDFAATLREVILTSSP